MASPGGSSAALPPNDPPLLSPEYRVPRPSTPFYVAFSVLAALCLGAFLLAVVLSYRRAAQSRTPRLLLAAIVLWPATLLLLSALSATAPHLQDFHTMPPKFGSLLVLTFLANGYFSLGSSSGAVLATQLSLAELVGAMSFRVLVEILLYWGHNEKFVPIQMTWPSPHGGRNYVVRINMLCRERNSTA